MGFLSDLFGGGESKQTVTNKVDIPDFLKPFLMQGVGTGRSALTNLSGLINGGNLVAPFNPFQQQAFDLASQFATGQNGVLPAVQGIVSDAAQNSGVPSQALSTLTQGAQGQSFLPASALSALTQAGQSPLTFNPAALGALQQAANGDFLAGGQGFDAAVDAAMRRVTPQILSTFAAGGAGAATGGLAKTAIAQATADAFANQFGQERANQLNAANQLANLGLAGGQFQLGALGQLAGMNQAQAAQQLAAAGQLGGLGLAGQQQQLAAAGMLPELGLLGSDVLSRIGAQQQAQAQQELTAPIAAQQQLLGASLGGVPIASLLGSTQTATQQMPSNPLGGLLGLGLTGASLFGSGGLFPGLFGKAAGAAG